MRSTVTRAELAALHAAAATESAREWLTAAEARIAEEPEQISIWFSEATRACGRAALSADWSTDTAARVLLATSMPWHDGGPAWTLFVDGGPEERRAVLLAFDLAEGADESLLPLTRLALAGNDTRLIAAALGTFAAKWLSADEFRQAVLKCAFCGVPFSEIAGLAEADAGGHHQGPARGRPAHLDRADPELARMLADLAGERAAAGRPVPGDVWPVLRRFPDAIAASRLLTAAPHARVLGNRGVPTRPATGRRVVRKTA